jgi:hypothetical protein
MVWVTGAYMFILGLMMIVLSFRLRGLLELVGEVCVKRIGCPDCAGAQTKVSQTVIGGAFRLRPPNDLLWLESPTIEFCL